MQLTREWIFDAAHRITNHPGKCRSLHGHTWRVRATVEGEVDPKTSMVIDFFELKTIGDLLFDVQWDHAALLNVEDPLVEVCQRIGSRLYTFSQEPTSEVLASAALRHFNVQLVTRGLLSVRMVSVEIFETPKCSATVLVSAPLFHRPLPPNL